MDLEIVGDRAYVASGASNGLETYDISNPSNIVRLSRSGPAVWNIRAYGDKIYVFTRQNGVRIYNISGSTPSYLGKSDPSDPKTLYENGSLEGSVLYVAAHQRGLYLIDVANPSSPLVQIQIALADNACWDVAAYGSYLLVANGRFGLSVVELTTPPKEIAVLPLPGLTNHIELDGDVAVLSLGCGGLATVDISDPLTPTLMDRIETAGSVFGAGLHDHKVAAGSWRLLEIFDISNPKDIKLNGWDNTKTWAMGADIAPYKNTSMIVVGDWYGVSAYICEPGGVPDIDVTPQYLDFGEVLSVEGALVKVQNTGTRPLDVNVGSLPTGIQADPGAFTVAPSNTQYVRITATGAGKVYNDIKYISNDPDEPSVTQYVYKNNTSFPQIDWAAPSFILQDLDGFWHYLSDYKGKVIYLEFGGLW